MRSYLYVYKIKKEESSDLNTHNLQETVFLIFVCSFYYPLKRIPLKMYLWHTCCLWVFKSSDIFLKICHSIENKLHPSFIDQLIVDFDKSRVQRYIFPNNRILLYDDIQSDCVIMQTDQPCTLSNLKE